jgi:hypothetical protein
MVMKLQKLGYILALLMNIQPIYASAHIKNSGSRILEKLDYDGF